MFKGKTAWFSRSVEERDVFFWVSEDGALAHWQTADFLFSRDSSSADTQKIYNSEDYKNYKTTVFHCAFLSVCEVRQRTSMPIGHYVLPPNSFHDEIRAKVGRFIWEKDEKQMQSDTSEGSLSESEAQAASEMNSEDSYQSVASPENVCVCCRKPLHPVSRSSGYVQLEDMRKYVGELNDIVPSISGRSVSRLNVFG